MGYVCVCVCVCVYIKGWQGQCAKGLSEAQSRG